MIKYYKNKSTGKLISFNDANNEVLEFEELVTTEQAEPEVLVRKKRKVKAEKTAAKKIRGGGEPDKGTPAGIEKCSSCGKKKEPGKYFSKGKCPTCYNRELYQSKHPSAKKKNKGHEADGRGNKYECIDCGQEITSTLDIDSVKCPKNSNHQIIQK